MCTYVKYEGTHSAQYESRHRDRVQCALIEVDILSPSTQPNVLVKLIITPANMVMRLTEVKLVTREKFSFTSHSPVV